MSKRKKKQYVQMSRLNWNAEYLVDIHLGRGFLITEPSEVTIDGVKRKSMYGSRSPLYGTTYEDEHAFSERYRCQCGTIKSRQFEGETCPVCKTKVECRDSDINMTGWIWLHGHRVISPYYYNILKKCLGATPFQDMITLIREIDINGVVRDVNNEEMGITPSSDYAGIGYEKFYNNFENIMKYFARKRKTHAERILKLIDQKEKIFVEYIPIPSTLLRPQSVTKDTHYFNTVDKNINTLFSLSEQLKILRETEIPETLNKIQLRVNSIWNTYFELVTGKTGWIRSELLGGRLNYTARNEIAPDPTLRDNEVDIAYSTFLRVYQYKIIYYIMKIDDVNLSTAYSMWQKASVFDEKVYNIMMLIVKKEDIRVLINRNPTLNFYSILLMKIRKIIKDSNDYSLSLPLSILPGLNADFDGDVLNIIGMQDPSIAYMFKTFDPIKRMIVDRETGELNKLFAITKGQLIDLYHFCTLGEQSNDVPETYPVKDNDSDEIIYVEMRDVKKYKSGIVKNKKAGVC